jgi:hypothetical protein
MENNSKIILSNNYIFQQRGARAGTEAEPARRCITLVELKLKCFEFDVFEILASYTIRSQGRRLKMLYAKLLRNTVPVYAKWLRHICKMVQKYLLTYPYHQCFCQKLIKSMPFFKPNSGALYCTVL